MGKKILDEDSKQDRRLKPQEAAVFKSSKNNSKVSTDLVISQAAPETKNMEIMHVKRANKKKKSRSNSQAAANPIKERKMFEFGKEISGDAQQPAHTDVLSDKVHESVEISGEAQQLTGDDLSGDEIPVNGEDNIAKEGSDLEGSLSSKDGNVSKRDLSTGASISKRKSRINCSPTQKKIAVRIKAGKSSKMETTLVGITVQDGNRNVTLRKKSAEGNRDTPETCYDSGNKLLNGNNSKHGSSLNDERKHFTKKISQSGEQTEFSFPDQTQRDDGNMEEKNHNCGMDMGDIPNFNLLDHSPIGRLKDSVTEFHGSEANADANKQTWKNMFTGNRNAMAAYKLTKNSSATPADIIELTEQDADDLSEHWGFALLAYVAGRSTGKQAIDDCCKKWGVPYVLHFHESGWIIIKFSTEEDRDKVLLQGPYYIFGKLLMLKELPRFFDFSNYEINLIPIWVHILKLPLDFWNVRSLSKLGGFLGKPIQTDKITFTRGRVSFVRILVEMDLSKPLPDTIPIKLPNGRLIEAKVEYEFIPKICAECKGIGHGEERCYLLHPELKPKNQPANGRAKADGNPVAAKKNYETRNEANPQTNSEANKVETSRNSFSQSIDLNQAKTSWKKVIDSSTRNTLEAPVDRGAGKRNTYNRHGSMNSEKLGRGKQVFVDPGVMQDKDIRMNNKSSGNVSSPTPHEREQQDSIHERSLENTQIQHDDNMGNYSRSSHHSGSDTEEGEFQIPNKRHTTRNMNWTKAVLFPDSLSGRGPSPSSPQ